MSRVSKADWQPQGVEGLEDNAWKALRESEHSVLVTAGAGAGKTEFLAQKATYLLQTGICPNPKRILAISFKKDAAKNLAERVAKRCPKEQARRFYSMTFDAFTKGLWDRFRSALPAPYNSPRPYKIVIPSRNDYEDFLNRLGPSFNSLSPNLFTEALARGGNISVNQSYNSLMRRALLLYWKEQFFAQPEILVSFLMLNRLVKLLLKSNPCICKALQVTYPFVFWDEFQDTTYAQYDLLQTAFADRLAVFTAVGDDKQRIMGWAGAMSDAFSRFESDFSATRVSLLSNWRSHEDLVHIQYRIARLIDSSVAQVQAKGVRTVEGSVAAIWQFPTPESESTYLAQWIKHEIDSQHIRAHDVAILVRKQAVQVEQAIASAFKQQGIRVRNVDRSVGEVKIQDLIGEDLTAIFIPLLRLGATERSPKDWEKTLTNLQMLERVDPSDERTQGRLQEKLAHFVGQLRVELRQHPPAAHSAEDISKKLFQFITPSTLQQGIPSYQRKADFERVRASFVMFLKECAEYGSDWSQILDEFEGLDQVPLMTVHKSKGLEFHTMIFYGLDNKTWWSLRPDKHEELNAFFVAFTRAKQRAFFSRCDERGSAISWIEDILHASGVETIDGTSILNSM